MMLPPISSDFVHVVAVVAVVFLCYWYLRHLKSGLRGLALTVIGSLVVLAAAFNMRAVYSLLAILQVTILPVVLAFAFIFLLALALIAVWSRRNAAEERAKAHLPSPNEMKCPFCRQRGYLHDYEVSNGRRGRLIQRMCSDCATAKEAKLVSY